MKRWTICSCALVALVVLGGCASDAPRGSATVPTAPLVSTIARPVETIEQPVAQPVETVGRPTTTTISTIPPTGPTGVGEISPTTYDDLPLPPSNPNLIGVAEAALAAHDEFQRQLLDDGKDSWEALLTVMTPVGAASDMKYLADFRQSKRRYEVGKVNRRLILRVEADPSNPLFADAIVCWQNDYNEFDRMGTDDTSDDVFIQDDLGVEAYVAEMNFEGERWMRDGVVYLEEKSCAGAF